MAKRVHEIAKQHGMAPKELLGKLQAAGVSVKAASSSKPCSASSAANSVSERMSIRHPVRRAARRAFWPSRPIASDSWSSGTITVACLPASSTSTSRTRAGDSALATKRAGSSL
jgi:hypothetical protein